MTKRQVIDDVLKREGWPAVTDKPSDRGGLTKGGVTFVSYNAWRTKRGLASMSREEFELLSEDSAREFYEDEFWSRFEFVAEDSVEIAVQLFDWAVMSGPDKPVRSLQLELSRRGFYLGGIDGVAGAKTRAGWLLLAQDGDAVERVRIGLIVDRVKQHVRSALDAPARAFMASYPRTQLHNLSGWLNRDLGFL